MEKPVSCNAMCTLEQAIAPKSRAKELSNILTNICVFYVWLPFTFAKTDHFANVTFLLRSVMRLYWMWGVWASEWTAVRKEKFDSNAKKNDKTHHFRWNVASANARSHITWLCMRWHSIALVTNNNNNKRNVDHFSVQNPTNTEKHMNVSQWPHIKMFIWRSRANRKKKYRKRYQFHCDQIS